MTRKQLSAYILFVVHHIHFLFHEIRLSVAKYKEEVLEPRFLQSAPAYATNKVIRKEVSNLYYLTHTNPIYSSLIDIFYHSH